MNDQLQHYQAKLNYEIDAWDLKEAIDAGEKVTLVDARSPEVYAHEHIPGAISLPHRTMSAESTASLDRGSLVVTYCDGIGCNASTKGAINLLKLGFRVKELMGGIEWWKREGYATDGDAAAAQPGSCGCG